MTLATEVESRYGTNFLIQLTNDDGTATTSDATRLAAAASDAQGHFRRLTGLAPDITQDWHLHLLCEGVVAYLERYKARDSSIMNSRMKNFVDGCIELRKTATFTWQTTSVLTPSPETSGVKPDMDRKGKLRHMNMDENTYSVEKTLTEDE